MVKRGSQVKWCNNLKFIKHLLQPTWHCWPFQFDARHFKIVNVQAYKFATGQFIFKTAVSKSHGELVTFFSESFTFPNRPYWIIQARSTLRKVTSGSIDRKVLYTDQPSAVRKFVPISDDFRIHAIKIIIHVITLFNGKRRIDKNWSTFHCFYNRGS